MTLFRFAGFELDEERAELRGPDGAPMRLRGDDYAALARQVENAVRQL